MRIPAAGTSVTLTAAADPTYGLPSPAGSGFDGWYGHDTAMRQVFQAGFLYKLNAWALLITSTDFRWSGACGGDLAFVNSGGDSGGYRLSCFIPSQDVLFGGTKVFTVTVDPSDGGVFIVGHTIFNATYALPAGLTAGNVTFGSGATAISLPIAPVRGSYVDPQYPANTGQSWVAKVSAAGVPLWAKLIGPSKPDANGQAAPVVSAGLAGFVYTGFAAPAPAAGRRLLDQAADDAVPVVAYFGELPPSGGAAMSASLRLGGFNVSTFTPAAQQAFAGGIAVTLNCSTAAVAITGVVDAAASRRRLLATGTAVVVQFTVQTTSTAAAAALSTRLSAAVADGTLSTTLQASLPQLTAIAVVSAPPSSAAAALNKCGALLAASLLALLVL